MTMTSNPAPVTPGAHLKLFGMALLWGASWPLGRALGQAMPPLTAASWRFAIASIVLLIWLRLGRGQWPRVSPRQAFVVFLGGAFGVFGYGVFFMLGLAQVEAGRAALVVTVNPVFTTLLAAWLFKERFNRLVAIGMALSVFGASYVLSHGHPERLLQGEIGHGEWLLLGCISCWVIYSLLGKRSMQGIDPLAVTTYTAVVGTVLLWVTALVFEPQGLTSHLNRQTVGLLFAMAIGPTVLAYAWYFDGIARVGAGTASSYISLVPVFGVGLSSWFLGEALDHHILVGGLLVLLGLAVMNTARFKK